ncbi:AzlC family ABC transporter permease [Aestuariivirga sp.]|uniref:AzlC family ABC transporter permease n=1 Tax=Aestuariivirga sp. TaxID=2650926 RepID=UPI003BA87B36
MSSWRRDFLAGVAEIAPVLVAVLPIGLLWGTLATAKGLSPFEAILMSAVVFAGSAQFVALEMWRDPVPVLLLTFTALIVNVRHVLMSASLSRHIEGIPRVLHPLVAYLLVDESWALAERRALTTPITLPFYLGLTLPLLFSWLISTGLGAFLGRTLGDPSAIGLDFAFSALFIAILMGFWKGRSTAGVLAASGAVAAGVHLLADGPWYIVAGGLAGAAYAAATWSPEEAA